MKRILFILTIIVSIFIINNLVHSIYDLWSKQDLLTSAQKELKLEKEKNQNLRGQLANAVKEKFIEEQARNKLFLVKPNEQVLVVKDLNGETASDAAKILNTRPNWRKWWELFF